MLSTADMQEFSGARAYLMQIRVSGAGVCSVHRLFGDFSCQPFQNSPAHVFRGKSNITIFRDMQLSQI